MPIAFYYLFAAIGFAIFALCVPKYTGLAETVGALCLALFVFWAAIELVRGRSRPRSQTR